MGGVEYETEGSGHRDKWVRDLVSLLCVSLVYRSTILIRSGQKHYSKQTVYNAHLSSDKHKKKESLGNAKSDPNKANGSPAPTYTVTPDKLRIPARITYLVTSLLTYPPIPQLLADSRSEVERRMALTSREREAELEEADEAAPPPAEMTPAEEEEDDDGKIYNPLKLPLGWDGKPIPYWLYKLHGLGVEFRCEVGFPILSYDTLS